jgi:hypothetical protein
MSQNQYAAQTREADQVRRKERHRLVHQKAADSVNNATASLLDKIHKVLEKIEQKTPEKYAIPPRVAKAPSVKP